MFHRLAWALAAAHNFLKVSKYCRITFHSSISYSSKACFSFSIHDSKFSYCVAIETEISKVQLLKHGTHTMLCVINNQVHIPIMNALNKVVCLQVNLVVLSKFS